jgi:hypothetical protein
LPRCLSAVIFASCSRFFLAVTAAPGQYSAATLATDTVSGRTKSAVVSRTGEYRPPKLADRGAAGVHGESTEMFKVRKENLYRMWNRICSARGLNV